MRARNAEDADTKQAVLRSAAVLFLERGFTGATAQAISERAEVTTGGMFNYFDSKEAVLCEIVQEMFRKQLSTVERILPSSDPALQYGTKAALQFHIAELNESLRDVYVSAYSLPTTTAQIHKMVTKMIYRSFKDAFPDYGEKDFYELEIGTAGLMRGYLAYPCNMYFTLENKIDRFLETGMSIYRVPPEKRKYVIASVHGLPMEEVAVQMVADVITYYGGAGDTVHQHIRHINDKNRRILK